MNMDNVNISAMNSIQHVHHLRQLAEAQSSKTKAVHACSVKNRQSHHPRKIALAMAGVLAFSTVARAATISEMDIFNNLSEVSDTDLNHMRGKFASDHQVVYFGVEMVSQWQTPTGNLVTAGANLNIDFRGDSGTPSVQYAPTVTIVQQGQASVAPSDNTNIVSGGAGLSNVSGVSQSIQVAGQSNSIRNGIDMRVESASASQSGLVSDVLQGQAGAVSANGSDGTVATVTLANNSIGVQVTVPGQGQVMQQIRNQGMFQSARIGGDLNQIHNAITMHIGINTGSGSSVGSAYNALQGLRGLPQMGMF